jgi:outer membrane protein assembly factor BamE (lipoprotein component of BamABCDE complex)
MLRYLVLAAVVISLTACVSTRARHGYVIERGETALEAEVGIDSKESILARYGQPSIVPALNANTWYYISSTSNARAFYQTRTTSREVVAFTFDTEGMVADMTTFDLSDGKTIALVDRETPSRGKELSFLEQLLGTVGQLPNTEQQTPGSGR